MIKLPKKGEGVSKLFSPILSLTEGRLFPVVP